MRRFRLGLVLAGVALLLGLALRLPVMPPLLDVVCPRPGQMVGLEALEVVVRFPYMASTHEETLRVLLNGVDVTDAFTSADNGAVGELHALLDGENLLQFEVFGRSWLLRERVVEQTRAVRFWVRRPIDLNWG